jgi:hypothetical protein
MGQISSLGNRVSTTEPRKGLEGWANPKGLPRHGAPDPEGRGPFRSGAPGPEQRGAPESPVSGVFRPLGLAPEMRPYNDELDA